MMNAVHARRDDDQIQNPFVLNRQTPVGMMKECSGFKGDEEHDQHYGCDPEDQDRNRKKSNRKDHFAEMKSRSSAYVEIEIGVMHVMETPEEIGRASCRERRETCAVAWSSGE